MWLKFEKSSIEDETINNAFSTNGLFKICTEEPSPKSPIVFAVVAGDRIVIGIENCLSVVDAASNECKSVQFEAKIDAMALTASGRIIVCALSDGAVHGIHESGVPLFCL